jgi:hypothetical protein
LISANQSAVFEVSTAVVEHKNKDQMASLETDETFILCGNKSYGTHIKCIVMLIHNDGRVEVPKGMFTRKGVLNRESNFCKQWPQ